MTTSKVLTIHEFSTGIQAKRTDGNNWVSQGFTGQYMNATLNPIPSIVRQAINNRLFAVAEGASRDEPTLIGREITEGEETWSVVAVVSKGSDDRGRSASLYRYFLSEGRNQLTPILRWLFNTKKDYVFNPFDYQEVGQPHEVDRNKHSPPLDKKDYLIELQKKPAPIIFPTDQMVNPLIVSSLATKKSEENGYPIAWAYQVEALEKPRTFQVIHPASAKAEQILLKTLSSSSNTPVFIENEEDLKKAIKGIFTRGTIKAEQLLILEQALQNPKITEEYWQNLFQGQGANKAIQQGIYSAQMIRLLALQAVILPTTLPKCLGWLEKKEKNEEGKKTFAEFQKQLRGLLAKANPESDFQQLKQKVLQGVRLLIPSLVKQPNLLFSVVSLLKPQGSLWGYFYHYQVKSEIEQDLNAAPELMRGYKPDAVLILVEEEPLWEELFQDIYLIWQRDRVSPKEKYLPLAEFFEQVSHFKPSALFYHIAWGEVPKEVFSNCGGRGNRYRKQIYEIWIKRHVTFIEQTWNEIVEIGGYIMPVYIFTPLLIVAFLFGGFLLPRTPVISGVFAPNTETESPEPQDNNSDQITDQNQSSNGSVEDNTSTEDAEAQTTSPNNDNDQEGNDLNTDEQTAIDNFDSETKQSITQLIDNDELFTSDSSTPQKRIEVIKADIFNDNTLQSNVIIGETNNQQKKQQIIKQWVNAIKKYQQSLGFQDGIISPEGNTHDTIRDELRQRKKDIISKNAEGQ